jgi:hypothetical protein
MDQSVSLLPEAPGTKQSQVYGVVAILFAITLLGSPLALVFGAISLIQASKAGRLAAAEPTRYAKTTSKGMVLGVVGVSLGGLLLLPTLITVPLAYDLMTGHRLPGTVQSPPEAPKGGPTQADLEAARQRILQIELLTKAIRRLEAEAKVTTSAEDQEHLQSMIREAKDEIELLEKHNH